MGIGLSPFSLWGRNLLSTKVQERVFGAEACWSWPQSSKSSTVGMLTVEKPAEATVEGRAGFPSHYQAPPNNQGPPQAQRKNPSTEGPWEAAGSGAGPSHPLGLLDETPQKAKTK